MGIDVSNKVFEHVDRFEKIVVEFLELNSFTEDIEKGRGCLLRMHIGFKASRVDLKSFGIHALKYEFGVPVRDTAVGLVV